MANEPRVAMNIYSGYSYSDAQKRVTFYYNLEVYCVANRAIPATFSLARLPVPEIFICLTRPKHSMHIYSETENSFETLEKLDLQIGEYPLLETGFIPIILILYNLLYKYGNIKKSY